MDSKIKIYIERAENEFRLARALFKLSEIEKIKLELGANFDDTFYSAVIAHSYYAIFYSAKAILLSKGIDTKSPNIHKKTYDSFENYFVRTGILDKKLLEIYQDIVIKADDLLEIFKDEKWKRGNFTYKTMPQANIGPAEESIDNTLKFLSNIKGVLELLK